MVEVTEHMLEMLLVVQEEEPEHSSDLLKGIGDFFGGLLTRREEGVVRAAHGAAHARLA